MRPQWLKFITDEGWAPSLVLNKGKVISGVQDAVMQNLD